MTEPKESVAPRWAEVHPLFAAMELKAVQSGKGDRFRKMLCKISLITGVEVGALKPNDEILSLCPPPKWSQVNARFEEIQDLVTQESNNRPISGDIRTLGELLAWLFELSDDRA